MPTPQNAQACAIKQSIVFLWVPYRCSRFHATANIRCTLQYILNQRKIWRNRIYVCIYIYTQYILWCTLSIYTCLVIWRLPRHQWHLWFLTNCFLQTKYDATNISSMPHVGAWKSEHGKSPRPLTIAYYCQKSLQRLVNGDLEQDVIS